MTEKHEVSESEYKRQCARAVIDWGTELSRRLSVDDAWRMLFAGTTGELLYPARRAGVVANPGVQCGESR